MEPNIENNQSSVMSEDTTPVENSVTPAATNNKLTMPAAVIIAGVLIALAVILTGGKGGTKINSTDKLTVKDASEMRSLTPINSADHIRGNISKAKVAIIEFSDLQCPYCKQMHPTLQDVVKNYGDDVAWVYRHFPLESIHPFARSAAHASECVNELGGNDAFWKFVDGVFTSSDANPLEASNMSKLAASIGVNQAAFDSCQSSGKYDAAINASLEDATNAGAQGTPDLTVINLKTKEAVHVGADPRVLSQVLGQMLK